MPALSLVVCVFRERDLLARLLREAESYYDELVVVHDGPDTENVREVVKGLGRFIENERRGSLEGQSPFAWAQATHDWILRLDADEFPSEEMKKWLRNFRSAPEPASDISGYTCIWPLWNGRRAISRRCWSGRPFLFNRQRIRFFGLTEQGLIPDGRFEPLDMILHHQPTRKSYGFRNVLFRPQAYRWRSLIAHSLLGKPTDLPCWRWTDENWPEHWEEVRRKPIATAVNRLTMGTFRAMRLCWRAERRLFIEASLNGPIHHALLCLKFWQVRREHRRNKTSSTPQ